MAELMKTMLGAGIGGSVGLIVVAAIVPTADLAINGSTIATSTAGNTLWKQLPLFLIVVLVGILAGAAISTFA